VPSTAQILSNSTKDLGLDQGKSIFEFTKAAVSSADGMIEFSTSVKDGGKETKSIGDSCRGNCEEVPMYSLQTYVDKFVKSKTDPINILSVDVEGFDFDVLFGAGSVLDRTEYIEFEFHATGNWRNYHIMDAINLLSGKGFTCYWSGQQKLWRLTECHHDVYNHWHGWSNVACVHRSQKVLATKMERLFLDTLESKD
jgi:FkbM family methyltransferase